MKQIIRLTLILLVIPFFIVFFFFNISDKKNIKKIVTNNESENELVVRVKREATGKIDKVALEDYIVGVVAGEMPINFAMEALKAQAVASRSYVLSRMENSQNDEYDVVDGTNNQVYLDNDYLKNRWQDKYNENIQKLRQAVSETHLQYISYNGTVADALFFSTSNGYTENSEEVFSSELPYLRSVKSTWDETTSPVFNDQKSYSVQDFSSLLGLTAINAINITDIQRSNTGRILNLKINGVEMKGTIVESKLKLRSTDFNITQNGNNITIKTSGYGHGVGMSQYGALGMAENGYKYDQILKYYYQGVEIATLKK